MLGNLWEEIRNAVRETHDDESGENDDVYLTITVHGRTPLAVSVVR